MLFIVSEHTAPENAFVQRAGIYLLNSLACHVNTEQKLLVGNLGAMEKMLGLISHRVSEGRRRRTLFCAVARVHFLLVFAQSSSGDVTLAEAAKPEQITC